jgi:hypothetical protein
MGLEKARSSYNEEALLKEAFYEIRLNIGWNGNDENPIKRNGPFDLD